MKHIFQNHFFVYILFLISVFVLLFITKPQYELLQKHLDTRDASAFILEEKEENLDKLNTLKNNFASDSGDLLEKISHISDGYSDDEIIEYIYSYAQKINSGDERIIIKNLSIDENGSWDLGFQVLSVGVSAIFSSEKTLFAFMNFVNSSEGKYSFQISSFDYPQQESGNLVINIPLTLYYK